MAGEQIKSYGMKPGCSTGHYQRYLDRAMGLDQHHSKHYHVPTPQYRKDDITRTVGDIPFLPPHEVVQQWVEEDP
eukprot:9483109-Pyramimonas_sp.AAC.1